MDAGGAPIFVVGASRSGTTMLRLMLNAHSRLGVPEEFSYFSMFPAGVKAEQWRSPGLSEGQYRSFIQYFLHRRAVIFEEIGIEQLTQQILSEPARDLRTPYRIAARAYAQQQGKARWGEKTPHNLFYVDVIADMFPDAKFIYLMRDPRAVVRSMNNIAYFSEDTVLNAFNWHQAATRGYALLEKSVPASQYLTIHYENLVRNTEQQVRGICDFLNEAFEPEMLAFHRSAEKHMGPVIRTPSVTKPVNKDSLSKWKHDLSESEIAAVESICGEAMQCFGYERTGHAPALRSRAEAAIKRAYWKVQRWRRRDERGHEVSYQMLGRTQHRLRNLLSSLLRH